MRKRLKQCIAVVLSVAIIVTAIPIAVTAQDIQPVNDLTEAVTSDSTTSPNSQAKILSEIVERREEDTKHFYMSDGTILAAKYNQPIHYLENGEWHRVGQGTVLCLDKILPNWYNCFGDEICQERLEKRAKQEYTT